MIKKVLIGIALVWAYNHYDRVSDGMVKAAVGFKTGVEATHKSYQVNTPDGQVVVQAKSKMLLPGPDDLIDPWPEN